MLTDLQATLEARAEGGAPLSISFQSVKGLSSGGDTDNAIIQGDNSDALELLKLRYAGKIRCAYIDPPYNNQERYNHYADNQSHETWLAEIVASVKKIKPLLRPDGSIWISIDDRQVHYLKVALDEVFGRENFVTTIVWEQRTTRENRKVFSNNHEYLLVYSTDIRKFKDKRGLLDWDDEVLSRFRNPDNDPRGPWQSVSANVQDGHATKSQFYDVIAPNGQRHKPPKGRCWVYNEVRMKREIADNNVWFGKHGDCVPRLKRFLCDARRGFTPQTLWPANEVGTNDQAKKHLLELFPRQAVFDTPKPEALIRRILCIASEPGDLILDAYLGSGTTAAVAHKMSRQYIGIEKGDHAATHCVERIRKVIAGEKGGISAELGWTGGGAFHFYKLDQQEDRSKIAGAARARKTLAKPRGRKAN
ncbi:MULTISPECIES: site-specific DNA-methyltransferase [unclassified Beijerinckia]|uniref:site-specific DNA-methyltransferase n=1 Tax=unclassified Beijerinckia TaxID=2638183 RepID=UPI00089C7CDE|nr:MULTISPECIES: site-specific DNA-methyltransferase [unclassified Beijerinckia]MDH7798419.1 adenine-specific DNA-methyltransferase [Beijerinckia sp. GAS462]SED20236.1 adenine-specific DNA-methyltransferase [Beijerinckia sp. 28-YEA-48]